MTRYKRDRIRLLATLLVVAGFSFFIYGVDGVVSKTGWARVRELFVSSDFQRYGALVAGLISFSLAIYFYRRLSGDESRKPAVLLRWWAVSVIAIVAVGSAWVTGYWLLSIADDAATRIDAIKTAFAVAAGFGAAIALLLSIRRQWHQELTDTAASYDKSEQRVTELYSKAVDQLGASELSKKLGGIYALERLGQDNENHRQTIASMICACLRMLDKEDLEHDVVSATRIFQLGEDEREIQAAVLGILRRHRNPLGGPEFWKSVRILDLRGANLAGADLHGMDMRDGQFMRTRFTSADMHGINLIESDMSQAVLNNVNLARSDLRGVNLHSAEILGSDLSDATLMATQLYDAKLSGTDLSGARWNRLTRWPSHMRGFIQSSSETTHDRHHFRIKRGVRVLK